MTYAIHEDLYPEVEKKLKRIAKKCAKYGNGFIFEVKYEEIREHKIYKDNKVIDVEYHKFILVEVEGSARIDDWECIAILEVHDVGNIIRRINTTIDIPERFKHSENICEHCNSKRQRNSLYIIHNVITNEWKQVGGNCLMLYTNGLSMDYVVSYLDGIIELEHFNGFVGAGQPHYKVEDVLGYAVEVIAKIGYFSSQSSCSTKHLVSELIFNRGQIDETISIMNKNLKNARIMARFCQEDFHKKETESIVHEIVEYYKSLDDNSEFIHNIKVMLNTGYILSNNFGFICYLPEGYAKHIKAEAEKAKCFEEKHEHFGEVGKRYKDKSVEDIYLITTWESQFGVTYLYKILLADGVALTWKTSKPLFEGLNEDDDIDFDKIAFTVKSHGEYKGKKQTEVTRCKIGFKVV